MQKNHIESNIQSKNSSKANAKPIDTKPTDKNLITEDVKRSAPAAAAIEAPAIENHPNDSRNSLDPTRYGDWERKGRAIDF